MPENADSETPEVEYPHIHEDGPPFTFVDYEDLQEYFEFFDETDNEELPATIN